MIIDTGSPVVFFLGDEVEERYPGDIVTPKNAFRSIYSNSDFANRRWCGARRRGRQLTGSSGVVRM
jgi:hypothetical protein